MLRVKLGPGKIFYVVRLFKTKFQVIYFILSSLFFLLVAVPFSFLSIEYKIQLGSGTYELYYILYLTYFIIISTKINYYNNNINNRHKN